MGVERNYVPLHVHSHFSLLDGLGKPDKIANKCVSLGIKSCALTDHGNIAGAVPFYQKLKANNIKPILGCELYICNDDPSIKTKENSKLSHFLVIAKNLQGWKTLIKIVSESNKPEYFYHKPRLSLKKLSSLLDNNIIGICGHLGSTLADVILKDQTEAINNGLSFIDQMKDMFGEDNFYLETQLFDKEYLTQQQYLTDTIRSLSQLTSIKAVCTPDAHYVDQDDAVDQRILLCNNLKTTLSDINTKMLNDQDVPMECFFKSDKYYILSPEEMRDLHLPEEIENTILVDSLIEDYDILSSPKLPKFECPNNLNPDEYLRELCRDGWKKRIVPTIPKEDQQQYVDRIKHELDVLQGAGLSSYFLIVQDIVNYVRNNNWLPGPGRGSCAGCLVSYLIGITDIDPIRYSLLFERFFNAARSSSMPDIDMDVPIDKRDRVLEYLKNKYGVSKVSQMITFNTMKGRGALKDVLRVYGNVTFEEMNNITKFIPDEAKIADELQEMKEDTGESSIIRWALENNVDKLKEWCYISEDGSLAGPLAKRFEQAIRLEGTKSNQSKHAAGVIIGTEDLASLCPMVYDNRNDQLIAGMEMNDLESLGLIKFDVLGLAFLDKIMCVSEYLKNGEI
jgi:DNA polymerase III subunit alpha